MVWTGYGQIRSGDTLLLAAAVDVDTVLIHPPVVLDKIMTLYQQRFPAMTDTGNLTDLDVARIVPKRLGLDPSTLVATTSRGTTTPTFGAYIPTMAAAVSSGARHVYPPFWNQILKHWEHLRLNAPTPSNIRQLIEVVNHNVVVRHDPRNGRGAVELFIVALCCIYPHAIDDGLLDAGRNPAGKVAKPTRLPRSRHALPTERVTEFNETAFTTGNDPELDTLILRFHHETAARRTPQRSPRAPNTTRPRRHPDSQSCCARRDDDALPQGIPGDDWTQ